MGKRTARKPKPRHTYRGAQLTDDIRNAANVALPPGEPYPTPAYAAQIWHTGRGIMLALPGANGAVRGHSIFIDDTRLTCADGAAYAGWATLLRLLCERHRATYAPTLGTRAAPTQHTLEAMLRAMHAAPRARRFDERGARVTSLADLGLDDE